MRRLSVAPQSQVHCPDPVSHVLVNSSLRRRIGSAEEVQSTGFDYSSVGCVGFLTAGCSDTGTFSDEQSPVSVPTIAVPQADVSATVDGAPMPGVDLTKMFCSRMRSIILSG